jgi:hypothetical protein
MLKTIIHLQNLQDLLHYSYKLFLFVGQIVVVSELIMLNLIIFVVCIQIKKD